MFRKILGFFILSTVFFEPLAFAAKTTYVYTNHRFQFVKRVESKKKELKKRGEAHHPYELNEPSLRQMLSNIQVGQKLILQKEVEEKEVFNKSALDFLVPHLTEAFKAATPQEKIVFSFVTRRSKTVFQDNRLTLAEAWVKDNFLHIEFRKLLAKLETANYDKLGDVSKAINRARGLRVSLDLKEGQQFGESTDEVLLPIVNVVKETPTVVEKPKAEKKEKTEEKLEEANASEVEERLGELEKLKKKGLITKKEYQQKKKEILKEL